MDWQYLFNGLAVIVGVLIGYIVKGVRDEQKEIASSVKDIYLEQLPKKVDKVDYSQFHEAIFRKLDRIEEKIDGKMDKP